MNFKDYINTHKVHIVLLCISLSIPYYMASSASGQDEPNRAL